MVIINQFAEMHIILSIRYNQGDTKEHGRQTLSGVSSVSLYCTYIYPLYRDLLIYLVCIDFSTVTPPYRPKNLLFGGARFRQQYTRVRESYVLQVLRWLESERKKRKKEIPAIR